jgi:hypothetical protein
VPSGELSSATRTSAAGTERRSRPTIVSMFSDLNKTTEAFDPVIRFDQIFGIVAFIGGFALILWNLATVWRVGSRRWPAKIWGTVLALSALVVLWVAFAFHLIGWGVHY